MANEHPVEQAVHMIEYTATLPNAALFAVMWEHFLANMTKRGWVSYAEYLESLLHIDARSGLGPRSTTQRSD